MSGEPPSPLESSQHQPTSLASSGWHPFSNYMWTSGLDDQKKGSDGKLKDEALSSRSPGSRIPHRVLSAARDRVCSLTCRSVIPSTVPCVDVVSDEEINFKVKKQAEGPPSAQKPEPKPRWSGAIFPGFSGLSLTPKPVPIDVDVFSQCPSRSSGATTGLSTAPPTPPTPIGNTDELWMSAAVSQHASAVAFGAPLIATEKTPPSVFPSAFKFSGPRPIDADEPDSWI